MKYLVYSHASLLECKSQLDAIYLLYKDSAFKDLSEKYDHLGGKFYKFILYIESSWKS